jgi:hypothetical protein
MDANKRICGRPVCHSVGAKIRCLKVLVGPLDRGNHLLCPYPKPEIRHGNDVMHGFSFTAYNLQRVWRRTVSVAGESAGRRRRTLTCLVNQHPHVQADAGAGRRGQRSRLPGAPMTTRGNNSSNLSPRTACIPGFTEMPTGRGRAIPEWGRHSFPHRQSPTDGTGGGSCCSAPFCVWIIARLRLSLSLKVLSRIGADAKCKLHGQRVNRNVLYSDATFCCCGL